MSMKCVLFLFAGLLSLDTPNLDRIAGERRDL